MRLAIARTPGHGGLHLAGGLVGVAHLPDRHAERVVGFGKVVVEADGLLERLPSALKIVLLLERKAKVVVGDGVVRVDLKGGAELLFRLLVLAHLQEREADVDPCLRVARVDFQHLMELAQRFIRLAQLHLHEAVTVARGDVLWIEFDGFRVGIASFSQRLCLLQGIAQ